MKVLMNCSAQFINTPGGVEDSVEVEVPNDFAEWAEEKQEAYLQEDFQAWLDCQIDSGFAIQIL